MSKVITRIEKKKGERKEIFIRAIITFIASLLVNALVGRFFSDNDSSYFAFPFVFSFIYALISFRDLSEFLKGLTCGLATLIPGCILFLVNPTGVYFFHLIIFLAIAWGQNDLWRKNKISSYYTDLIQKAWKKTKENAQTNLYKFKVKKHKKQSPVLGINTFKKVKRD